MVTNIEYCSKHIKSFHAFGTTAKEKKNELLELCVGDEKKKGPHRDCNEKKDLIMSYIRIVLCYF